MVSESDYRSIADRAVRRWDGDFHETLLPRCTINVVRHGSIQCWASKHTQIMADCHTYGDRVCFAPTRAQALGDISFMVQECMPMGLEARNARLRKEVY